MEGGREGRACLKGMREKDGVREDLATGEGGEGAEECFERESIGVQREDFSPSQTERGQRGGSNLRM